MGDTNVLASAATSASYNMILQLAFRVLTFILNAFTLRYVTKEMLGVVNVRLTLLYSTVLLIVHEAFFRACTSKLEKRNWPQIINLLWCTLPIGVVCASLLSYVWIYVLEPPNPDLVSNYHIGVLSFAVSTVIELLSENVFVASQVLLFVRLKVVAESCAIATRCVLTVALLVWAPHLGMWIFCIAQLLYSCVKSACFYGYFVLYMNSSHKKDDNFPYKSVRDFFPRKLDGQSWISWPLAGLTWSFFKQSFLKQILTEGERYVMTVFDVLSFGDQGVYDVINNLGSLAARFIFLPIEESGYLFFSHSLTRGLHVSEQKKESLDLATQVLESLLKIVTLIGCIILVFGHSYSHLLLDVYGGTLLSSGTGPLLLKWYCVYVLLIAVNGVTECFVFASMSRQDVDRYNHKMLLFSILFLCSSWYLTTLLGSVGFILANCLNMMARISHSIYYILKYFKDTGYRPLYGLLPSASVVAVLGISFLVTFCSEKIFCCDQGLLKRAAHVGIGAVCGLVTLSVIYLSERNLVEFVKKQYKERHKVKSQ